MRMGNTQLSQQGRLTTPLLEDYIPLLIILPYLSGMQVFDCLPNLLSLEIFIHFTPTQNIFGKTLAYLIVERRVGFTGFFILNFIWFSDCLLTLPEINRLAIL